MSRRRIIAASALLAAGPCAAAHADAVRDVMIVERGGPHVWIALDATPAGVSVEASAGRLVARLEGFEARQARRITPVDGAPLTQIRLEPAPGGARLVIEGAFSTAEAELRQGGVWIALDGALDATTASASARGSGPAEGGRDAGTGPGAPPPQGADSRPAARTGQAGAPGRSDPPAPAGQARPPAGPGETAADAGDETPAGSGRPGDAAPSGGRTGSGAGQAPSAPASPEAGVAADPDQPGPCDATAAAVQASPWDLDALSAHADCLSGLGARDNAAGLYERVLAFDPTHFRAAIGLARIREAQGRGDEAARLYERAAGAAMTDGEALAARAAAERNRDDPEER